VLVTGIRNKAYEERVGTYKRVESKRKKKQKTFRNAFCKELVTVWMGILQMKF
jgi:hypothetical protein